MAEQTRIRAEKMRVDDRSPVHRRCCGLWWTWRWWTWRGAWAAGWRLGRRIGRICRSRFRGLRSLSQEFTQRLEGTVGLCHPQLRPACWTRILSCDLLRVVTQCRKVRILEMKRGACTDMKAAAVGVLDVGACRGRRYRPVRQPRENDQEQADGITTAAERPLPFRSKIVGPFASLYMTPPSRRASVGVPFCPAYDHAVLFRPCCLGATLFPSRKRSDPRLIRSRCRPTSRLLATRH